LVKIKKLFAAVLVSALALTSSSHAQDPLPSWNDTAPKKAITAFVERVTREGSPDFVPPAERIATFDNDGCLWSEQPMYFQLIFAIDRVKTLAPQHSEWKTKEPFASLLSPERTAMMDDIQSTVNRQAKQYGAEIIDVRIKRADLPSGAPLESAFLRMRSARQQEATTIRAQGLKQAQLVRADADAKAASIYAGSFGKDPQFYAFYRAMQAYRTTFNDKSSTVVMSPNNEFLREFEGRNTNR
jgi:hypothetical protein